MKNKFYLSLIAAPLTLMSLSATANISDLKNTNNPEINNVDLLILVEPALVTKYGNEELQKIHQAQVDFANKQFKEFNVHFNISAIVTLPDNRISDKLANGEYLSSAVVDTASSAGYDSKKEFDEAFYYMSNWEYSPFVAEQFKKYHADKVVISVSEYDHNEDVLANAFQNKGFTQILDLTKDTQSFAHELGHNFGLGHTSSAECSESNYLMCSGTQFKTGFTANEKKTIQKVVNRDLDALAVYAYDNRFWNGDFNKPMPIEAHVKFSVSDNPIPKNLDNTEMVVELVDAQEKPTVLDHDVAVQLYTNGTSAKSGINYSPDTYQTVTFAAGEQVKRVDLPITHSDKDTQLTVGTRYGVNVADSNPVDVTINAVSKPKSSESSGGSMSLITLFGLILMSLRRKMIK